MQGHIWRTGFSGNELEGIVFDDVPEALERWHALGIKVVPFPLLILAKISTSFYLRLTRKRSFQCSNSRAGPDVDQTILGCSKSNSPLALMEE